MPRVGALFTRRRTFAGDGSRGGAGRWPRAVQGGSGRAPGRHVPAHGGTERAPAGPRLFQTHARAVSQVHAWPVLWGSPPSPPHCLKPCVLFLPWLPAGLGPLPDEYFQPTAGRVRRPGSDEFVEVPTGGAEEDADPYYTDA